jgi:hypothetical protein
MVLEQGEIIHVMIRRNFEDDLRRHFAGEVVETEGILARIEGYAFVLDTGSNKYIRLPDKRIRLVGLADPNNIINILPAEAVLSNIVYTRSKEGRLVVTDNESFSLDINEFGKSS